MLTLYKLKLLFNQPQLLLKPISQSSNFILEVSLLQLHAEQTWTTPFWPLDTTLLEANHIG